MPSGDGWMYEPKWDGHRVLARRRRRVFDAVSSTGKPKDVQWPWLATVVAAATEHDVILDGEVIAYADDGHHSFQLVGSRDHRHHVSSCSTSCRSTASDLHERGVDRPASEAGTATVTPERDRLSIQPGQ